MALTYANYLKLDELLSLQQPQSQGKAHDEMLFIVIHQTYELWFKEVLHEIDLLRRCLETREAAQARATVKRILSILKVLVSQMDVLETMSSPQFLTFRNLLGTASGFQSVQFRELEFVLGNKRREVLDGFPEGSSPRLRLEKRFTGATLWDSFMHYLSQCGYAVPAYVLNRDFTRPIAPSRQVQAVLLQIYAKEPDLANLCELLLDLDEGVQEWRYRHIKMVERIIGSKYGTGGSSGVEYLKTTLFNPSFPDLWAIRTEFGKQ
jgi:tryptophan 2,3-dioxygenase